MLLGAAIIYSQFALVLQIALSEVTQVPLFIWRQQWGLAPFLPLRLPRPSPLSSTPAGIRVEPRWTYGDVENK